MTKKTIRRKKQKTRQTNWWLIGGILGLGVLALLSLLALSLQEPNNQSLTDYCLENTANCIGTGAVSAPVTIIEVSDFGCTHCRDFHQNTWPSLETQFVATGQVRWLSVPYALRPETVEAAEAALCAGEQEAYFAFGQAVFTQPDQLASFTEAGLLEAAVTIGLDTADFQQCLNDGRYNDIVAANIEAARQAGVTATPTFFVNGRKLEGAYPFSAFKQQIESLLGS